MKKAMFACGVLGFAWTLGAAAVPTAKVDGKTVEAYEVTLSAGPINKIFDGNQRDRAQTKKGYVLSFDYKNPFELRVTYPEGAPKDLTARPLGRPDGFRVENGEAVVSLKNPEQLVLTSPSGGAPDVHIFANAPFKVPEGPRVRRFARGEHHPGLIAPESNETIVLDEGAVVHSEVFVLNATNVTICGRGRFVFSEWERADARAKAFRKTHGLPEEDTEFACLPFVVYGSKNVRVEGVTLEDAPFWTFIVRNGSSDVGIDNVKIVGNWRYNSDGINVCAAERVNVRNCFIRSFDDCLVARAPYFEGDDAFPTKRLRFEGNRLWCDWGKNCEVWAGHKPAIMEDIVFRNNAFLNVHFTGCDVTTWFCSASTYIGDIVFEDNEYDLCGPRWKTVFQTKPGEAFNREKETEANLLSVDAWAPAENLGNQHFGPARDWSLYKLEYDGIRFARPRIYGADGQTLTIKSETTTPYQHIRNLVCEDIPEGVKITTKGNTRVDVVESRAARLAKLWRSNDRRYVFIASHRGDWRHHPENSIPAILGAAEAGADIVEIDLHRTRDGVFVLSHDDTVDRCTDGHGAIADKTLAEIRTLRLREGQGGPGAKLTQERMPTFAEALRAAKGRVLLNLDRAFWIGFRDVLDEVVAEGALDEIVFKGNANYEMFKLVIGPQYAKLYADGTLSYMPIFYPWTDDAVPADWTKWQTVKDKPRAYEFVLLDTDCTKPLHTEPFLEAGAPRLWINVMWSSLSRGMTDDKAVIDPASNWRAVLDLGATALQTDRPARMRAYLESINRR